MADSSDSEEGGLKALISYSDDALFFFDFQSLSLVFCNAMAAKMLRHRNCVPQPGTLTIYDATEALLGGHSQSVVDDMLERFQQGHAYVWEPRSAFGSLVSGFFSKYYKGSSGEGILVKAKSGVEHHGSHLPQWPSYMISWCSIYDIKLTTGGCRTAIHPSPPSVCCSFHCHQHFYQPNMHSGRTGAIMHRNAWDIIPSGSTTSFLQSHGKHLSDKGCGASSVWTMLADPEVQTMLEVSEKLDLWDAFKFDHATLHQPLTAYTLWALRQSRLIQHFNIPEDKLVAFLGKLEHCYADNPYHNRIHAADVTRSIHYMFAAGMSKYFTEEQQLALYIGAAAHDVEHGGLSNTYLCATNVCALLRDTKGLT
jgi:hypothetical protein